MPTALSIHGDYLAATQKLVVAAGHCHRRRNLGLRFLHDAELNVSKKSHVLRGPHGVPPRLVSIPRVFRASAIARKLVQPDARMSAMMASNSLHAVWHWH